MLKVGLTGSIGSGKSVVSTIFSHLGVPVYNADSEAKKFLDTPEVTEPLALRWGEDILDAQGSVIRQKLAGIVFHDRHALDYLNQIIHPLVKEHFLQWCSSQNASYVVQEAAILYESGFYSMFDKIVCVSAPEVMRINRVMKRDGVSRSQVLDRMLNQWPEEKKVSLAHFVVHNDEQRMLLPQILSIHQQLNSSL